MESGFLFGGPGCRSGVTVNIVTSKPASKVTRGRLILNPIAQYYRIEPKKVEEA